MEDLRNGWQRYDDWLKGVEIDEDEEEEGGVWHVENGQWVRIETEQR